MGAAKIADGATTRGVVKNTTGKLGAVDSTRGAKGAVRSGDATKGETGRRTTKSLGQSGRSARSQPRTNQKSQQYLTERGPRPTM